MPRQTHAAARRVVAPTPLDALPQPLALRILSSLPVDARLLAAAVCRSWRVMLADPALWTRLDLSPASGVANPTDALLHAGAARAGGLLEALRVCLQSREPHDDLMDVLASNAGTMRELALCTDDTNFPPTVETIAALLRAAPGLRLLETGVNCWGAETLPMLRKEPPFGPLRLKRIMLRHASFFGGRTLADCLAVHGSLEHFKLDVWPRAQAESDALVGTLLSLPLLRSLELSSRAPASVLARVLGHTALKSVHVYGGHLPLLDSPASTALLCDALQANTHLQTLTLLGADLWHDMDNATALLATLQAHPSLKLLGLPQNAVTPEHAAAAGAALGALIAHSPALETLHIWGGDLGDAGLGPVMDALPRARCLQTLDCRGNGIMSEAFARERLLPAVRACASLRKLETDCGPAVHEDAILLLWQRR